MLPPKHVGPFLMLVTMIAGALAVIAFAYAVVAFSISF